MNFEDWRLEEDFVLCTLDFEDWRLDFGDWILYFVFRRMEFDVSGLVRFPTVRFGVATLRRRHDDAGGHLLSARQFEG